VGLPWMASTPPALLGLVDDVGLAGRHLLVRGHCVRLLVHVLDGLRWEGSLLRVLGAADHHLGGRGALLRSVLAELLLLLGSHLGRI